MFKKKNDGNGEKIFRYSIRKYHFGAASVAVAALMFFANGVQAQAPAVSSATASDVVAGSAGNSDGDPQESDEGELKKTVIEQPAEGEPAGELKTQGTKAEEANQGQGLDKSKPVPVGQEGPQVEEIKEREESTPTADKTAAKSTQGTLEALLAKLTLSSMQELHAEVEARLAAAKAVLENPKATQEQVDEQVRAMEELTRRVREALSPQVPTPIVLEKVGMTNHGLAAPEGAVTEQATGGKRRKRVDLSQATPAVDQVSLETIGNSEKTESSEKPSRQELPTYTNQGDGAYKLKDELEFIYKRLQKEGAEESKIQAAKAAADKFNEAFSKGDTIDQEDFAAALVDLKKSRDLIEGVLESKYGEAATTRRVNIEPRDGGYSGFRNATYSGRSARAANPLDRHESYIENGKSGDKTYDRYTYVFYSSRRPIDNSTKPVSNAKNYILARVTPTNDGFHWELQINNGHRRIPGTGVWFTIPSGQTVKQGTDAISITRKGGGTTAVSSNDGSLISLLRHSRPGFGNQTKGTVSHTGINGRHSPRGLPVDTFDDLARHGTRWIHPYERRNENEPGFQDKSNAKFTQINSSGSDLYYFSLGNNDDRYKITFDTKGYSDINKLDYAVGLRGSSGNEVFLVNQWHSRTYNEAKEGAKDEIEQARRRKNDSIGKNGNLSSIERDSATAKVDIYARQATDGIEKANSLVAVDDALRQGLENINGVNPVGKEDAKQALQQKAQDKKAELAKVKHLTREELTEANGKVDEALRKAKEEVDKAKDQNGVTSAKTAGIREISKVSATATTNANAKQELDRKAQDKKAELAKVPHLTREELTEANGKVDEALRKAKEEVDKAKDQASVETAKTAGIGEISKVSATASANSTAKQGNSSTPGNGGNQAGSDSRGDAASQGDRPAPSGDGSQGDANNQDQPTTPSAPAHSGNSTDQATDPSAQERETGNATAPESPQGLSGSSVTAPARSRRSVSFAGGTQSSQEKQVDKSVLRDLIQDLETRLKDLDGIDQSVIDAAKVILGEGQEALRNADLSEAGLKEMTAKVKEALESLKGKQATKDEEEMQEISKEQGHLPYGTMIGSLLALLGLLLFLIARRKKESELKKLTKELTKVLQESDLTSVDAKVLDQAREALAQAVAFLANEKESDHTEDELIEKLKAVLAQLR